MKVAFYPTQDILADFIYMEHYCKDAREDTKSARQHNDSIHRSVLEDLKKMYPSGKIQKKREYQKCWMLRQSMELNIQL